MKLSCQQVQTLPPRHGRIMIDFIDPLIVAERIATTENTKYLTIRDIKDELRDGEEGVSRYRFYGEKASLVTIGDRCTKMKRPQRYIL